jgi:hypothetical protein
MDWFFLLVLGLVLFFARDVLLLNSFGARGSLLRTGIYGAIYFAWFVLLGSGADYVSRQKALELTGEVRLWAPAILAHGALWLGFLLLKRRPQARSRLLALTLIPAPMFVYCAGGLCWLTLSSGSSLDGTTAGGLLGAAWVVLVAGAAWCARRFAASQLPPAAILDFAAASNLSAILLLPLHQQSTQSAAAQTAFDGWRSAMALAATAGLIGASFLFHRLRRAP